MITSPLLKLFLSCSSQKWCMSRKNLASCLKLVPGAKSFCLIFLALAIISKGPKSGCGPLQHSHKPGTPSPRQRPWPCMCHFVVVGRRHWACARVQSDWLSVRPSLLIGLFIYCDSPVCWSIEAGLPKPWEQPPAALPEGGPPWMLANERVSKWIACWCVPEKMHMDPSAQCGPTSLSSSSPLPFLPAEEEKSSCYLLRELLL